MCMLSKPYVYFNWLYIVITCGDGEQLTLDGSELDSTVLLPPSSLTLSQEKLPASGWNDSVIIGLSPHPCHGASDIRTQNPTASP